MVAGRGRTGVLLYPIIVWMALKLAHLFISLRGLGLNQICFVSYLRPRKWYGSPHDLGTGSASLVSEVIYMKRSGFHNIIRVPKSAAWPLLSCA